MEKPMKYAILIMTFIVCGLVVTATQTHIKDNQILAVDRITTAYYVLANDTADFQNKMDLCPSAGCRLYVPDGVYTLSSSLNLTSNIEIIGLGDHVLLQLGSGVTYGFYHYCLEYNVTLLTTNITEGQTNFTVADASAYSVGDLVQLKSNLTVSFQTPTDEAMFQAETGVIRSILGNDITLEKGVLYNYTTTGDAKLYKIPNIIDDAKIRNIHINGTNNTGSQVGVYIRGGRDIEIENVDVTNTGNTGVSLANVYGADIFQGSISDVLGSGGYGITANLGSRDINVYEMDIFRVHQGFDCGGNIGGWGLPSVLNLHDNTISDTTGDGVNGHYNCRYMTIKDNNIYYAGTHGIDAVSGFSIVKGNTIVGSTQDGIRCQEHTLAAGSWTKGCEVADNTLIEVATAAGYYGIKADNNTLVTVKDNTFVNVGRGKSSDAAIRIVDGVDDFSVKGNAVYGAYRGVMIDDTSKTQVVRDNHFFNIASENYYLDASRNYNEVWNQDVDGGGHTLTNTVIAASMISDVVLDTDSGLVVYYPFNSNGTAEDYVGFHDGIINDNPAFTTDAWYGGAYDFDGNDSIFIAPSGIDANVSTISAWINVKVAGVNNGIIGASGTSDYVRIVTGSNIYVKGDENTQASPAYTFNPNTWYYITVTQDAAGLEYFVNGTSIGTDGRAGVIDLDYIGRASNYMNGTIDDVKVWNRVLSDDEILAEYEGRTNMNPYMRIS